MILESFVDRKGKQVCGDGYMEAGKLRFICFGDGHFYDQDDGYMAPYAETFPSTRSYEELKALRQQIERILNTAGLHNGVFNFDAWLTASGKVFVNEIGPRSGGNYIPLVIQLNTGVDLVAHSVEQCLDLNAKLELPQEDLEWAWPFHSSVRYASYMIHSRNSGRLQSIELDERIAANIIRHHPYVPIGSWVEPFHHAGHAIGNYILKFDSEAEMQDKMADINQLVNVRLVSDPMK